MTEHQRLDTLFGQHVSDCCGLLKTFDWRVNDQSREREKLITVEALNVRQRKEKLNTSGETMRADTQLLD